MVWLASPITFTVWQISFSRTSRNEELDHRKASDQGSFPVLDIFTSALSTPAICLPVAACSLTFFLSAFL
uniref:Uncharacterized protein n=1 Tax=Arundo donax TaxID=35708 RepID=A0A0A8ZKX5_ARUDO